MCPSSAPVDPDQVSGAPVQTDPMGTSMLSPSDPQAYLFLSSGESKSEDPEKVCTKDAQEQECSTRDSIDLHPYQERAIPTTKFQRARRIIRHYWVWEIIGCLFSLTCALTVSVLFWHENGTELENWHWFLSPNVTVSYIGSMIKVSFVMVLSEILCQLKWIHFKATNPLEHLRIFDSASRGPIGSAMAIWSLRRWLASIAAILMICSLFVDSFFQLAINYQAVSKVDKSQRSFYLWSNVFNPDMNDNKYMVRYHGEAQYAMYSKATKEMLKAIDHGLSPSNRFINTTCPTGNCIWPDPITMLGVCGKCDNVTASIKHNCSTNLLPWQGQQFYNPQIFMMTKQSYDSAIPMMVKPKNVDLKCDYSFPTLASSNQTLTLSARGNMAIDGDLNGMKNLLWNSSMDESIRNRSDDKAYIIRFFALQSKEMKMNDTMFPDVRAWTCELNWCAKTLHNITVSKGDRLFSPANESDLYYRHPRLDSELLELYPKHDLLTVDKRFSVHHRAAKSLRDQLSMAFSVSYGSRKALRMDQSGNDEFVGDTLITNRVATSSDLDRIVRKLASSLTDMVRSSRCQKEMDGNTMANKIVIQVNWAWFVPPIILPVLTGILLAVVAVRSHTKDVAMWKDDPLALLFHRLDNIDLAPLYDGTANPHDLDSVSKEVFVELSSDRPLTLVRTKVIAKKAIRGGRNGGGKSINQGDHVRRDV